MLVEQIDEDVEEGAGQRLRQIVLLDPAAGEIPQPAVVGGNPDLLVVGQLRHAVEQVEGVEIAAGRQQQVVDDGIEVQRRHQRHQVGRRFVEAEIFPGRPLRRQPDLAVDDQVAELMGDDVEVQAERPIAASERWPPTSMKP
jgi:hypothetical protein